MNLEAASSPLSATRISDFVYLDAFLANVDADSKAGVLQVIAEHAAHLVPRLSAQSIFNVLWEREELGSTGIEAGIAIPHGRFKAITAPLLVVAKTVAPVDFGAIDEMPSDLFFMLLAPAFGNNHLQLLSRLARMFQLRLHADRLRYCQTAEQMHLCFLNWEAALPC